MNEMLEKLIAITDQALQTEPESWADALALARAIGKLKADLHWVRFEVRMAQIDAETAAKRAALRASDNDLIKALRASLKSAS